MGIHSDEVTPYTVMPSPVSTPVGSRTRSRIWRPSITHGVTHHSPIAAASARTANGTSPGPRPNAARMPPISVK